jgi:ABC-type phosphate/phosphonate transport system substrate-binding protein
MLSKHGLKAADVKGTFVGHHPQDLIDQTLAGKFDATVTSDTTLKANRDKVRVLETSDPFPGPPVTGRRGLPDGVVNELRRLFLSYDPAGDSGRFSSGVTNVTNADYNRIRFLCKVLFNKMYQ